MCRKLQVLGNGKKQTHFTHYPYWRVKVFTGRTSTTQETMTYATPALFLIIAVTSSQAQNISDYTVVGALQPLCALDVPQKLVTVDESEACVPLSVLCASSCRKDSACVYFNADEILGRCELFHVQSCNVSVRAGCSLYKV